MTFKVSFNSNNCMILWSKITCLVCKCGTHVCSKENLECSPLQWHRYPSVECSDKKSLTRADWKGSQRAESALSNSCSHRLRILLLLLSSGSRSTWPISVLMSFAGFAVAALTLSFLVWKTRKIFQDSCCPIAVLPDTLVTFSLCF